MFVKNIYLCKNAPQSTEHPIYLSHDDNMQLYATTMMMRMYFGTMMCTEAIWRTHYSRKRITITS